MEPSTHTGKDSRNAPITLGPLGRKDRAKGIKLVAHTFAHLGPEKQQDSLRRRVLEDEEEHGFVTVEPLSEAMKKRVAPHSGAHSEFPGFITGCSHDAALARAADRDRLATKLRIVALLNRGVEGIHVDVDDLAVGWLRRNVYFGIRVHIPNIL
jgi:hypothetical protein